MSQTERALLQKATKLIEAIERRERWRIDRIKSGLARARSEGKRLGRPSMLTPDKEDTVRSLLAKGTGINKAARAVGIGSVTVRRIKAEMHPSVGCNQQVDVQKERREKARQYKREWYRRRADKAMLYDMEREA